MLLQAADKIEVYFFITIAAKLPTQDLFKKNQISCFEFSSSFLMVNHQPSKLRGL